MDLNNPYTFGISFLLLALFMFASGVVGTLIGIALAKGILRAINADALSSCHERQHPIEHRQLSQTKRAGETHGSTSPASRASSGNLSKFRRIRITGGD